MKDYARARIYYADTRNDLVYVRSYNCPCITPYLGQNELFVFSKARFSKRLERFCSMHATAVYCHHGMDVDKASFFVLELTMMNPQMKHLVH